MLEWRIPHPHLQSTHTLKRRKSNIVKMKHSPSQSWGPEGIEMFCKFHNSDVDMFTLNDREYTHILETLVGQGKSCRNTRGHVDCGVTLYVRDWVGSELGVRSHRGASIPHMVEWGRLASSQSQSSKNGHRGSTQHRRGVCVIQAHWTRQQIRLAVQHSLCHIVLFHYNPATVGERS